MIKVVGLYLRHPLLQQIVRKAKSSQPPRQSPAFFRSFINQNNHASSRYLSTSRAWRSTEKSGTENPTTDELVTINWIQKDGSTIVTKSPVGMHLLDVAHKNNIDLEGACEGSLACSTCHVVIRDPALYEKLPEPTDEENDMLDLAFGLTETSRLGCQVHLTKELDGMEVILPSATRNMMVDGYKPPKH